MSSRCSIAADARLHPAVAVAHPVLAADWAGSVSSQASVAVKRCGSRAACRGVAIQSPRDTSSWRSSTTPADSPARADGTALAGAAHRLHLAALRRSGSNCDRVARSHAGRARCGPTACAAGGRRACRHRRAPRTAPAAPATPSTLSCVVGRRSSNCSSDGPSYQRRAQRLRHVVAAQRRHRHDAGQRVDAGFARKAPAARRAPLRRQRCGSSTRVDLVDGEHDARHAQQLCQQRVAARLRQQLDRAGPPVDLGDVHQHHGGVAAGGGGDHVARVLLVARRVGDDELALRAWRSSGRPRRW